MSNFFDEIGDHAGQIIGGTAGAIYGGPEGAYEGYQLGGDAQNVIEGNDNSNIDGAADSGMGISTLNSPNTSSPDWVSQIATIAQAFNIFS